MTDREAFEAWISAPPFERNPERFPDDPTRYGWPGNYRELDIELAWCAWHESRRAALTDAAKLADRYGREGILRLRDRESGDE